MKGKKDYTLTTSAFTITIHWNGEVVGTQLCILIGVILMRILATQEPVIKFCNVVCLIDVAAMVLSLLIGSSFTKKDRDDNQQAAPPEQAVQVEVAEKEASKGNSRKSTKQTEETIRNKVPTPTASSTSNNQTQQVIQEVHQTQPEPEPAPVEQSSSVSDALTKSLDEMTAEDWDALFGP